MVHADSAGVPFEGRAFHENPAADDDGSADARLVEAVLRFRSRELGVTEVVAALGSARLLVPLVTERGDEGIGAHGQLVDKTQELALVTVAGPDGRTVLPVFSSVDAMRTWNPGARPIPVPAPQAALAAAADDLGAIVLDPGSPTEFAVRRTGFEALATGARFIPCYLDERVLEAFLAATTGERAVRAVQLAPGDPDARLTGPELIVQLALDSGLDRAELNALHARLGDAWAASSVIASRVDSIAVRLESL
ncbi:MAG: SseB family protein [Pseudolysinimonas sp.]|uniref:SseB family protein n=1 Tax=Pseudolysinimonas sp. TaxID=2680009 RepID=UPI003C75FE59